ncbi:pyruvate formate lyase family protein [Desulfoglaeba alkanexedens]|uniref:Formate acetyltransferase n=1 Tax=Desulfoglaeba alkanexedens ALDC TaxID=980445 RepID=A0A4P8L3M2_9BACT|nr:pyruvate formate lyase family protein [Desulfoglaeba alkanexedens]QCQ22293.1 formate acetyltransferase [Desulfoglaeba alkanexedens ALDC]
MAQAAEARQDIEQLKESQQWWKVAEKLRSPRLDYLRKAVWKKGAIGGAYAPGIKIEIMRNILFTESWKENERDPIMMRKAKALAHVWRNIPIFITDHAQLVGYVGSAPNTLGMWPIEGASMVNEEAYNEEGVIPEPEEESLKIMADLNNYWAGNTAIDQVARLLDPEDAVKFMSGAIGWGVPTSAYGYSGKDYEYILTGKRGFEDIMEEIEARLDEAQEIVRGTPGPELLPYYEKIQNWEAMLIVLEAAVDWARRYARLARIIAENFESDPKRKEELLGIAETCERVPAKAPRSLQESLQMDHFIQILARYEAYEGAWPARPDYYHGPFYDKDVNIEKNLTHEQALELVGEFLIRAYELGGFAPRWTREGLQGITGTWVWTIGGVKPDGTDACNDLTRAFLQAARLVRVANPTFAFRWHPKVPDDIMRECFECIRHGLGYPSMRNDPILVQNAMYWHGHPLEEARTWVHQACMSPCPTTKHGFQPFRMASATANCAKMIEYALFNGYDPVVNMQMGPKTGDARKFKSFDELFEAWVKQMEWLTNTLVRTVNLGRVKDPEFYGRPFLSAISERSVEQGTDIVNPEGERGNSWVTGFTWVENADSLAAVKKLVFDEKKYTMDQLIDALQANWDGYEEMRLDFVRNAPKWGNDDDYVDQIMVRCLEEVARHSKELKDPTGNPWPLLPENVSGNIHYANIVGALPNGRKRGDALYDGGISPGPGLDKKGPTAVLKSCGKFDHVRHGRAFLLNQRLSPTQLKGEQGYQLWKAYMRTWADLGLDHVQFNMVDDATLRAAQKDPEKYQEVIVRVAGYSAHFVDISRKTQDNIIQRTIQGL